MDKVQEANNYTVLISFEEVLFDKVIPIETSRKVHDRIGWYETPSLHTAVDMLSGKPG